MRYFLAIWATLLMLPVNSFAEEETPATTEEETFVVTDIKMPERGPSLSNEEQFRASLQEGGVTSYFDQFWLPSVQPTEGGYYRKLIAIKDDKSFVIQDFFVGTNNKQSDPVVVKDIYDLKQNGILQSIDGLYVYWYPNGQKQYEANYKEGTLDGVMQGWYNNGQMKFKSQYQAGKKTGQWLEWYDNGQKKSESNYTDDARDGLWGQWHDNGQHQTNGSYSAGKIEGLWTTWDANGQKLSEGLYKNGDRTGPWTYYIDGHKWAEGSYLAGKQDGVWVYWKDGVKFKEVMYKDGVTVVEVPSKQKQ